MVEHEDLREQEQIEIQLDDNMLMENEEEKLQEITSMAQIDEIIEHERREARRSVSLDDLWQLCRVK